jgi:hypothetical protein
MSAIRVSSLTQTCERNPSQWEGSTDDGTYIYARYRWGCLSIGTGMTIEEAVRNSNNLLQKQLGDNRDGRLEYAKLQEATKGVVDWPEPSEIKGHHP